MAMEHRLLEITVEYAEDLNKVNLISKMDVYVVVSISGAQKTKTPPDHDGDANPMWRFPMNFTVEEVHNRLMLDFKLKCQRPLKHKLVGEVHVPLKDLPGDGQKKFVSYQVNKPNGKPKGQLTFSYRWREAAPPVEEAGGVSMITYPVVKPSFLYPATVPAEYAPPPPPSLGYQYHYQALPGYVHPPPVMQLGPNWWIVDWRYDYQFS